MSINSFVIFVFVCLSKLHKNQSMCSITQCFSGYYCLINKTVDRLVCHWLIKLCHRPLSFQNAVTLLKISSARMGNAKISILINILSCSVYFISILIHMIMSLIEFLNKNCNCQCIYFQTVTI